MKKLSLLLLTLSLQANAEEPNYSNINIQGAEIENFVEITYKHPKPRKVGDKMPLAIGKWKYEMDMHSSRVTEKREGPGQITCYGKNRNRETIEAVKDAGPITGDEDEEEIIYGLITGYDINPRDWKGIAEYEVVQRKCDIKGELKNYSGFLLAKRYGIPYAVYDIPNKLLYVDAIGGGKDAVKRDGIIDSVVSCGGADSLENAVLHIPVCGKELVSSEIGRE